MNFEKLPWQSLVFVKLHASSPEIPLEIALHHECFPEELCGAFWQAVLYNTSEHSHLKVFISMRKDLSTKYSKKLKN